jgi:hypothetical protein
MAAQVVGISLMILGAPHDIGLCEHKAAPGYDSDGARSGFDYFRY